jgi:hypothetical protein
LFELVGQAAVGPIRTHLQHVKPEALERGHRGFESRLLRRAFCAHGFQLLVPCCRIPKQQRRSFPRVDALPFGAERCDLAREFPCEAIGIAQRVSLRRR